MSEFPYQMIAIDLDGTLLSPDGSITPRVVKAVHGVLAAGMAVCFATGRNFTECREILRTVNHHAQAVFVGGAVVMDTQKGVTLHQMLMDGQLAAEVAEYLESQNQTVLALQDHQAAGVDYLISDQKPLNEPTRQWLSLTRRVRFVPSVARHSHVHTMRLSICAAADQTARLEQQLRQQFSERIISHCLKVTAYDVEVLEVFDPAVNKWNGILKVAADLKIAPSRIVAVGDDVNDLPMIQNAGLGVAMGNARPNVQSAADRVIGTNTDEGLAKFLEELIESRASGSSVKRDTDAAA